MKKVIAILTTREDIALWDLLRKETETATFVGFWGKNEVNKTECVKASSVPLTIFAGQRQGYRCFCLSR